MLFYLNHLMLDLELYSQYSLFQKHLGHLNIVWVSDQRIWISKFNLFMINYFNYLYEVFSKVTKQHCGLMSLIDCAQGLRNRIRF